MNISFNQILSILWLNVRCLICIFNWLYLIQWLTYVADATHLLIYLSLRSNFHHKDWLTYSGGSDRFGELRYNLKQIYSDYKLSCSGSWRWLSQSFSFGFFSILWHSCWLRWSLWSIAVRDIPWNDIFEMDALMLFLNFVSTSRLELICISLIVYISSSLIHSHGSQLVLLLP